MDKQAFKFGDVEPIMFTYNGQVVKVIPYLSYDEMKTLAHTYILELMRDATTFGDNIISAELSLAINILDLKTNMLMYAEDGKPLLSIDQLLSHRDLHIEVVQRIGNYPLFLEFLEKIVEQYKFEKTLEASLGNTLRTISVKVINLIDELSALEPNEENMNQIRTLLNEVNNSPVLKDAITIFKNGEKSIKKKERVKK